MSLEQLNKTSPHTAAWQCGSCGFVYNEAQGWPSEGIAPGTAWAQVPDDWRCPDCSSSKDDFVQA